MASRALGTYLVFLMATGLVAMGLYVRAPSEPGSSVAFGLSAPRLLVAAVFAGLLATVGWVAIKAWTRPAWANRHITLLEDSLQSRFVSSLSVSLLMLAAILLTVAAVFVVVRPEPSNTVVVAGYRLGPIGIWLGLASAATYIVLMRVQRPSASIDDGQDGRRAAPVVLLAAATSFAVAQALLLHFRVPLEDVIPGWFWPPFVAYGTSTSALIAVGVVSALIGWVVVSRRDRLALCLVALAVLGYALQMGVGFVEGRGLEAIRERFYGAAQGAYNMRAVQDGVSFEILRDYSDAYGNDFYLSTKPPGLIAFYLALEKATNSLAPEPMMQARLDTLSKVELAIFPALSLMPLLLIFALAVPWRGARVAALAGLLFVTAPNVILFPLTPDQALYPVVFLVGLAIPASAKGSVSPWRASLAGAWCYLAAFLSFSLLTLIPLVVVYMVCREILLPGGGSWRAALRSIAAFAAGAIAVAVLFRLLLGYDPVLRLGEALAAHESIKNYDRRLSALPSILLLNNVEFASWAGFPIVLLAALQCVRSLGRVRRGQADNFDVVALSLAADYVFLNLFGRTTGEVGRLWLLLVPPAALLAGNVIEHGQAPRSIAFYVLSLQLMAAAFLFKYQGGF